MRNLWVLLVCIVMSCSMAHARVDEAGRLLEDCRWAQAESAYDRLLKQNPEDAISLNNRGFARHRLGKYEEAIADYDIALKLKPNWNVALNNKGRALRHLKRFEEAQANFTQAIKLSPYDVHGWNNRGRTWADLGKFKHGVDDLTKAIALDPDYSYPYYNRGICYRALLENELADRDFETALELGYPQERRAKKLSP